MQTPPLDKSTLELILKYIVDHPYILVPLIFYIVTAVLSYKRDKSFWQVWFNGKTPGWMMGKKHRERLGLKNSSETCHADCIDCEKNMSHTGSGNQDSGNQDSGNQDSGNQDSGNQDSGNQDSGNQDSGNQDSGNQDSGNQDSGNQDSGNQDSKKNE
jgi:hypothetical protein